MFFQIQGGYKYFIATLNVEPKAFQSTQNVSRIFLKPGDPSGVHVGANENVAGCVAL